MEKKTRMGDERIGEVPRIELFNYCSINSNSLVVFV